MLDEVEAEMEDKAVEVMQDEVEDGEVPFLDEEEAVKKQRCNVKQHSTFGCQTIGERREREREREIEVQCF